MTKHDSQSAFDALSSTHLYGRRLVIEWAETTKDLEEERERAMKDMVQLAKAAGQ
jgi:multiple RNA-binding domain-containing protein 1